MIKNLTTGATEQAFTFDSCQYLWVKNTGDSTVYISPYSNIVAGADNVATLVSGDAVRIPAPANKLYTLGQGTLAVHAINTEESPFKSAGKGGGSDGVHFKGSTSTALTDGATTNPITIDGSSYTAVMGDMVIYSNKEFLFDGTSWHEMGDLSDTVGRKYYVDGNARGEIFNGYEGQYANTASGSFSHAEGSGTIATGVGAHAEGETTEARSTAAHAEGYCTTATGAYSHAEGNRSAASGDYSHAEGGGVISADHTTASGASSHAEGIATTASGEGAHAEGSTTTASGDFSHAEGAMTTASAIDAHAEGASTTASGAASHAEGVGTVASEQASHVSGKYNDFQTGDLFEIGNGTDDQHRSNIVEVSSTYLNVNGAIKANGVAYITPYTTMPTVTAAMVGQIAQYMGVTNSTYTRGWFYEAVSDPTYSWEVINFPKVPGGGDALTATQNGVYVPTSAYGYSSVTVNVPFYARTDATLADVSTVEGDEMHIEPTAGTSYYPRLFLMATPSPNPESVDPVDVGKLFEPDSGSWAVQPYIDIIDKATGQSVTGYPQQVHTSASFAINSGGYIRIKGWKVVTSGNHLKVSVTTTRWNTTYSNPIDDTYSTQSDIETWLSAYTTPPYVIKDDRWDIIGSGQCGNNAYYKLYRNGTLDISGTGLLWTKSQIAWDKTKVVDVIVNEGITALGSELFKSYSALKTAHIPSTLTAIGGSCFARSTIENVDITSGISSISAYAFQYCTNLTALTLPNTVNYINNTVFTGCSSLTSLTVLATTPPRFNTYGPGIPSGTTIYVPYDSVNTYKTRWSNYADQIQPIVTIGDMIDLDTQSYHMYHMTEDDLTAVGIRVYGTQDGISMLTFFANDETQDQTSDYRHMWTKNLSTTLYEGDYMDIYSASIDDSTTDPQSFQTFLAAFAHTDKLWVKQAQQGGDILTQFSFIFKGTTNAQSTPTRTLAADPMIRSTLSAISDMPNIEIEDE